MKVLILLCVVAFASCVPLQDNSVMRSVIGNIAECMKSDLSVCLKEQALKAIEKLRAVRKLDIAEGVTIFNNGPKEVRSLELSAEPEVRSRQLTDKLWESTSDLVKNSELELSWAGPDDEEESRALDTAEEGRGKKKEKKKKIKLLVSLLILAKIKAAIIALVSLVVIAASLAKLAILAKLAFIAKVIAILKYLIHKKHHQEVEVDHGWIPHHEVHEEHGHGWDGGHGGWDGGHGGWDRSSKEAQNIAYSAYAN